MTCRGCGASLGPYQRTRGRRRKYCPPCAAAAKREYARVYYAKPGPGAPRRRAVCARTDCRDSLIALADAALAYPPSAQAIWEALI